MSPKLNGNFVNDVTIPDDTLINAGENFIKTWRVRNTGDVGWGAGFAFVYEKGTQMTNISRIDLPTCPPAGEIELTLTFTAPTKPGKYFSDWRFVDDKGNKFGEEIYVRIVSQPVVKPAQQQSKPQTDQQPAPSPAPKTNIPQPAATNNSYFLADITIPDDTRFEPNSKFVKTWRVRNSGSLAWGPGYTLNFISGTRMTPSPSVSIPPTAAGAEANLSVELNAPAAPGTYYGDWRIKDDKGQLFGAAFWIRIVVPDKQGVVPALQKQSSDAPAGFKSLAPHLSQRDPRWANVVLGHPGSPNSIARWGCMMTCLTMLANTRGFNITPADFNELMKQRDGFFNGYFTRWEALSKVYNTIVFEGKVDMPNDVITRIDASLAAGRPVPVIVDYTPQTQYSDNDQHWVLVVGRNGDDYLMNDPWMLDGQPVSLLKHYGRSGGDLRGAVRSALFYR